MDSFVIPAVGFLAITTIFAAGLAISMRTRLRDANEARRRLRAGWESKLREEEHKRRELEQELSKIQDASKRLQEARREREKEEQERHPLQAKEREHEEELRDRTEKGKLVRSTSELSQSIEKLAHLQDEMKCMIQELREAQRPRHGTEQQGRRTAQDIEQSAHAERGVLRKEEEMIDRFGSKTKEVAEKLHMTPEEQTWLNELLIQGVGNDEGHLQ